jgi:hypothetical protein
MKRRQPGRGTKRKGSEPAARPAEDVVSALPMEIQVGDRFTDDGFEWEVMTHPAVVHGAKTLRASVQRPGRPETEREITWPAHMKVRIRRRPEPRG